MSDINSRKDLSSRKDVANQEDKGSNELTTTTLAETENFMAWQADEPDDEITYHLELNNVTLHFFKEEWEEFLALARDLVKGQRR